METLNTIQKTDKLNKIYRFGSPGPGGAYHAYVISYEGRCREIGELIAFQRGPRDAKGSQPGALDEDLLEIVRDRLTLFQAGEFACRENALALTHIEEALMWLNRRKEDRKERGVLGTYEK